MGTITLIVFIAIELFFLGWTIQSRRNHVQEKSIVRIAVFTVFIVLLIAGILDWGFRYYMIFVTLAIHTIIGVFVLIRKTERPYKLSRIVKRVIGCILLYAFTISPAILFPQYKLPAVTGSYEVSTAKYTWIDENRIETFSDSLENRALTVEFWYPQDALDNVPLIVFSHGAFGASISNQSTYMELASNGYVVASIGHTYHAFFTMDTNGKLTTADTDFINSVNEINSLDDYQQIFNETRSWLQLRIDDGHFVIDRILAEAESEGSDQPFSLIDTQKIGVIGHSLGGASFAQLAREREDINAVINLDGSMLGEELGVENGKYILNDVPYPVPLLNIYDGKSHYEAAMLEYGENYSNFYASRNAITAYEIIFHDAGHLNFTDLPLFSPPLAKILGVGKIDVRYCIEKTNRIVLEFFDCYLKGGKIPNFEREY